MGRRRPKAPRPRGQASLPPQRGHLRSLPQCEVTLGSTAIRPRTGRVRPPFCADRKPLGRGVLKSPGSQSPRLHAAPPHVGREGSQSHRLSPTSLEEQHPMGRPGEVPTARPGAGPQGSLGLLGVHRHQGAWGHLTQAWSHCPCLQWHRHSPSLTSQGSPAPAPDQDDSVPYAAAIPSEIRRSGNSSTARGRPSPDPQLTRTLFRCFHPASRSQLREPESVTCA